LLGDLRAYVGKKFWVRRPAQGQAAFPLETIRAAIPDWARESAAAWLPRCGIT